MCGGVTSFSLHDGDTQVEVVVNNVNPRINITMAGSAKRPNASQPGAIVTPTCFFWDKQKELWSNAGCDTIPLYNGDVVCSCEHLTDFSYLYSTQLPTVNILSASDFSLSWSDVKSYPLCFIIIVACCSLYVIICVFAIRRDIHTFQIYANDLLETHVKKEDIITDLSKLNKMEAEDLARALLKSQAAKRSIFWETYFKTAPTASLASPRSTENVDDLLHSQHRYSIRYVGRKTAAVKPGAFIKEIKKPVIQAVASKSGETCSYFCTVIQTISCSAFKRFIWIEHPCLAICGTLSFSLFVVCSRLF